MQHHNTECGYPAAQEKAARTGKHTWYWFDQVTARYQGIGIIAGVFQHTGDATYAIDFNADGPFPLETGRPKGFLTGFATQATAEAAFQRALAR